MTTLLHALQTKDTTTLNGMVTNSSSLNNCVNLFFQIGAMRGGDKQVLINSFVHAFNENELVAMKLLFWARDVRGGAGERQIFKDIVGYLAKTHINALSKNLELFSEYGRWDDLLSLFGTKLENEALYIIKKGLEAKNSLCCKWMPRPTGIKENKDNANIIRRYLGLTPKAYRKLLAETSNTVEQLMCAKNWGAIDYSKIPSKAMSDNMKSFNRNDMQRFSDYLVSVEKGDVKINAGALYPYDVIKNLKQSNDKGADLQWSALPNYFSDTTERLLPLVDVSGSMSCSAGNNPSVTCMDVSISLGLYISEKNVGAFKDAFITFSSNPELQYLSGTLSERYNQLSNADWGMTTNLEAAFTLILDKAKKNNVPESEMPTMVLVLSDMEYDAANSTNSWNDRSLNNWNPTAQEMIKSQYLAAGYNMPKVVYWNLNAKGKNFPVQFDEQGTCLVSGFSPAILKNLLSGKDMTPYSMMMNVVNSKRYEPITL